MSLKQQVSAAVKKVEDMAAPKPAVLMRQCYQCGNGFIVSEGSDDWFEGVVYCQECKIKHRVKIELERAQAAEIKYNAIIASIPAEFREVYLNLVPDQKSHVKALLWQYGPKGLVMYGPTGCGKTRTAWAICKREMLAGRKVVAVDAFEIAGYAPLLMKDADAATEMVRNMADADILLLDDIFKATITPRVRELVFMVIDKRTSWQRPIILTVNGTGEGLQAILDTKSTNDPNQLAKAVLRRIRDYCDTVQFKDL